MPFAWISRVNVVSSFTSKPLSSIALHACGSECKSNVASMIALSFPFAIKVLEARVKDKVLIASIKIDLPAPVSPVNALKPLSKSRLISSIKIKF